MRRLTQFVALCALLTTQLAPAQYVPSTSQPSDLVQQRFARFDNFRIKGVCGDRDLESLVGMGVNTVRGYSNGERKETMDTLRLCLGSTIFIWGHPTTYRPTYFSLLLDPDPNGPGTVYTSVKHMHRTPQAEVMIENATGKPFEGNRAPVLTKLAFKDGGASRIATPGEAMSFDFDAEDPEGDPVSAVAWILDSSVRPTKTVTGPIKQASTESAAVAAPEKPGEYLLLLYMIDIEGCASGSTLPFKVPEAP